MEKCKVCKTLETYETEMCIMQVHGRGMLGSIFIPAWEMKIKYCPCCGKKMKKPQQNS